MWVMFIAAIVGAAAFFGYRHEIAQSLKDNFDNAKTDRQNKFDQSEGERKTKFDQTNRNNKKQFDKASNDRQEKHNELSKKIEEIDNQNVRSESVEIIYGSSDDYTPRVKAEATKAFIEIEQSNLKNNKKDRPKPSSRPTPVTAESVIPPKEYVDLTEAKLNQVRLDYVTFNKVAFTVTQLNNAEFTESKLNEIKFRGAFLNNAKIVASVLNSVEFSYCEMDSIDFSATIFSNTIKFKGCKLPHSDFSGAITSGIEGLNIANIIFEDCDLRHCNMEALIEGNHVTIKSSNIYNMKLPMFCEVDDSNYKSKTETDKFEKLRKRKMGYQFNFE